MSVPDADSLDRRLFGRYWVGLDVPRHLTLFSGRTLRRALSAAGFSVVDRRYLSGSHYSFTQSLRHVMQARLPAGRWRDRAVVATRSPVLRAALMPYWLVIERLGLGAVMTVCAQWST